LFGDDAKLDEPGLKAAAKTQAFASCLASGEFAAQVAHDREDGKKAGIESTPSLFINGCLSGQPVAEFEKVVNNELNSARIKMAARAAR
jgi:protein-disulfide isomerase